MYIYVRKAFFYMNDEIILEYFVDKSREKIYEARVNRKNIEKNRPEMAEYLKTRFSDGFNGYSETIARIYNKIEKVPTCRVCGKSLKFKNLKHPYGIWCSCKCQLKDTDFIKWRSNVVDYEESAKRGKETKKEKYGSENYNNRDLAKKTCIERYGVECPLSGDGEIRKKWENENLKKIGKRTVVNVDKIRETKEKRYGDGGYVNSEKRKKTMKDKYGSEYTLSSDILSQRVKKTKRIKYGDENYTNQEKCRKTLMERYGVENPYQIKSIRERLDYDRIISTKRKLGTLNSSAQEDRLNDILINIFGKENVIREYRDNRYRNPKNKRRYCCDFYIKNEDLFIELQGHYTHGRHPFDENNFEDAKLREAYESKISDKKPTYQKIIDVWCNADVIKRNVAREHGLKYLEIFDTCFTEESIRESIKRKLSNS